MVIATTEGVLGLTPAAVQSFQRLGSLDLATVGADDLMHRIEHEAVQLFGLRRVEILPGAAAQSVIRTPAGIVVSFEDLRLTGEGALPPGWRTLGRLFAAHAGCLVRANRQLEAETNRHDQVSSLYAMSSHLVGRRSLDAVLTTVVTCTRELLKSDLAYLMLLEDDGTALRIRAVVGNRTSAFTEVKRPVRPGVSVYVGKPLSAQDFLNDSGLDHDGATDDLVRLEGLRSVLSVPVEDGGAPLGALVVGNRFVKEFTDGEVTLLGAIAEHAASALMNANYSEAIALNAASSIDMLEHVKAELEPLQRDERVVDALTKALLLGDGIAGAAAALAKSLAVGVLVTDGRHTVLADIESGLPIDQRARVATSLLRRAPVKEALTRCASTLRVVGIDSVTMVAPISARQELLGYIWVTGSSIAAGEPPSAALELAARVLALEMLREREAEEAERRLRRDFLYELLSDRPPDPMMLEPRARQVWRGYGSDHRPLVVSVTSLSADADGGNQVERARRLLVDNAPGDFLTVHGGYLVVLTSRVEPSRVVVEVDAIRSLLATHGLDGSVAIGARCHGLAEVRASILTARRVLELLGPKGVIWTEGLEALTILFDPSQRDRLDVFVHGALAPLKGKQQLIATLSHYYEAGGNRAKAARTLGIHVNTLRQRLERVEALIGGPIDEGVRAVPLRLALLARGASR